VFSLIVAGAIITAVLAAYVVNARGYPNGRDPTYEEALQFVSVDQTDRNTYNQTYTCFNFASDFVNDALKEGYRCAYVVIEFADAEHAIVAFNTSDEGLVFIEPQNDEFVTLTVGQPYLGKTVVRFSVNWPAPYELTSVLLLSMIFLPSFTMMSLLTIAAVNGKHPSETETDKGVRGESSPEIER
jgi:hypothetical protein